MIDDVAVGGEHAARQPVVAQKLPDILDRVQFGRSGGQQHQREVVGYDKVLGAVPSGPVSISRTPWAPGATACATSARCRLMACVSHRGSTRAAPLPCCGQIAPKM